MSVIAKLPKLADQLEYHKRVAALKGYFKDKSLMVSDLEAQAAMAETLDEGLKLKLGDVKAERDGKGHKKYVVGTPPTAVIDTHTVTAWRKVAAIPFDKRELYYAETARPTRNGLLKFHAKLPGVVAPLPEGLFSVIYADPPWEYDFSKSQSRQVDNKYPTMTVAEICSIDIPSQDDSVLFLWATSPKLIEALQVMAEWGYRYKTNMVWVKDRVGMGYWARARHELLLIGTTGSMLPPKTSDRPDSVIESPRTKHSEKPECVYSMVEKAYSGKSKIELFARQDRAGWTSWGYDLEEETSG